MRAAPRIQHESGRIRLAWMFVDQDGYAPAALEARVGRLDFDGAALVMIDRETGQTLAFERTLEGSADASSDTARDLPLSRRRDALPRRCSTARARQIQTQEPTGRSTTARRPSSGLSRRSLEEAKADALRQAPNQTRRGPTTGVVATRRIDSLLMRFSRWPDTAAFGPAPRALVAAGGWWAGSWSPDIRRGGSTRLLTDVRWKHIREQRLDERFPLLMSGEDPRVPVSDHVDPEPTLAWQRHAGAADEERSRDAAKAFGPTTPTITLDPPGAISVDPVDLASFASERVGDRYHWLRDDGGALLYVCGEHKVIRGGPEPAEIMEPLFEYLRCRRSRAPAPLVWEQPRAASVADDCRLASGRARIAILRRGGRAAVQPLQARG